VDAEKLGFQGRLMPAQLRGLQQAASSAGPADVTYVKTPLELLKATADGARHIQITEHLDLTTVAPIPSPLALDGMAFQQKLKLMPSTWSIQVRPSCPRVLFSIKSHSMYCNISHDADPKVSLICCNDAQIWPTA
jgi:hypothetical protein